MNHKNRNLGAKGIATRSKDATRGSWPDYYEQEATRVKNVTGTLWALLPPPYSYFRMFPAMVYDRLRQRWHARGRLPAVHMVRSFSLTVCKSIGAPITVL